ncbi:uncharacterized protein EDB91DRAFT_1255882 [Suillus paluster]|uniref:uncharacterized protein n=1 Tax=Suillus paluster TaxID=48578 RepID=UPI001B8655EB|nr:uncharacterized protein EDB91DRAFT_1255882 [Suillus paluster]KAG1722829.1 hypothetical protein EDB91DRAFT_1255882 [Suillus paluster]
MSSSSPCVEPSERSRWFPTGLEQDWAHSRHRIRFVAVHDFLLFLSPLQCMAQLPGFANRGELMPVLALYFNGVLFPSFLLRDIHSIQRRDGSNATAEFTPIPRVYITSDYQETAVLQSAIETPMIWEYNLGALAEITTWNLLT